jgi:hypothetical protein
MKPVSIFLFVALFFSVNAHSQMLYKSSQSLGDYIINYEVWNAANSSGKYTVVYYVTSANQQDCITFDADITAFKKDETGVTSVKRQGSVCLRNGKSDHEYFYTRFVIESPKNKLKSIQFSNLVVTHSGKNQSTGSSNPN